MSKKPILQKNPYETSSHYRHYFCSSLLLITRKGWKIVSDIFIPVGTILELLISWEKNPNILNSDFTIKLKLFEERSSKTSLFLDHSSFDSLP